MSNQQNNNIKHKINRKITQTKETDRKNKYKHNEQANKH